MAKQKGHWPKGRSRNLAPGRVPAARNLCDLLRRAIDAGWRHPLLGKLSLRVVAKDLKVNPKTVHKWVSGVNLPTLAVVDQLRRLLKEFQP